MSEKLTAIENPRGILGTLESLRRGRILAELSEAETALVAAVRQTGRKGTLTLKVQYAVGGTDNGVLVLHSDIDVKLPKQQITPTIVFADDDNRLHRHDPRQTEMRPVVERAEKQEATKAATPAGKAA